MASHGLAHIHGCTWRLAVFEDGVRGCSWVIEECGEVCLKTMVDCIRYKKTINTMYNSIIQLYTYHLKHDRSVSD